MLVDSNSCGTNTSSTWNLVPYPKYSGSTADYTITPTSSCQSSGAHSIIQGGADYYPLMLLPETLIILVPVVSI